MRSKLRLCYCLPVIYLLQGCGLFSEDCPEPENANFTFCYPSVSDAPEPEQINYPEKGKAVSFSAAHVSVTRVTNNENASNDKANLASIPNLRHHYSRRQAWNVDETMLDLGQRIVSTTTLEPVLNYEPLASERNWSNLSSQEMIGIYFDPKPNKVARFNFENQQYQVLISLNEYEKCTFGDGEGNLTPDDRYIALVCDATVNSEPHRDIVAADLKEGKVIGTLRTEDNFNWASFSESGEYILVENNRHPDPAPELVRYSSTLTEPITLTTRPVHGDLAQDNNGQDLFVMLDDSSVRAISLRNGQEWQMKIGNQNALGQGHISCRNSAKPNWCFISTYGQGHVGAVLVGSSRDVPEHVSHIKANKVKNGPNAYIHWGFHNTSRVDYRSEAKATVNRSATQILFTSNWSDQQTVNEFLMTFDEASLLPEPDS